MARKKKVSDAAADDVDKNTMKSDTGDSMGENQRSFDLRKLYEKEHGSIRNIRPRFEEEFGTDHLYSKPSHIPQGIEFTWAPSSDDPEMRKILNKKLREEGWTFLRAEHVAGSKEEAKEKGLFAFHVDLKEVSVAGTRAMGIPEMKSVGLWRPKEVGDKVRAAVVARFRRKMAASEIGTKELKETRGPIDELVGAGDG